MTNRIPAIITASSITVAGPDFVSRAIPSSHPNFQAIREKLMNGASWGELEPLLDLPTAISRFLNGRVTVENGLLKFNGKIVDNGLSKKILEFIASGEEGLADPLIRFLDNVQQNPSHRAVQGLYDWLERSGLPITPDGCILAWKIVGSDYKDLHSRRFDNRPGKVVQQSRSECDEDPDRTCSRGLHFCSDAYLPNYGSSSGNRIVVVKVHPRDVVAFPRDYDISKGRACRYEVVGEVPRDQASVNYFGGAKVFGGFSTVDELLPLREGQRVVLRDGSVTTVERVFHESNTAKLAEGHYVFVDTGRGSVYNDSKFDVVALDTQLVIDLNGVYVTREGDEVTINGTNNHPEYSFRGSNGLLYNAKGEYLSGVESDKDLVSQIG